MPFIHAMLLGLHQLAFRDAGALIAVAILAPSLGCQALAPSAVGSFAASREEKRVLKAAEADPFPSPADVGIANAGDKP